MMDVVERLPLDHDLSPQTGWTRAHHELVADRQLLALRPWASPGHARFELPGPSSQSGPASDGLEAFARSFLTAGFRLGGSSGDPHDHAGWYAAGLAAGTDPTAVDRWPRMCETRQARVEAAALVIGLHESRRWIWDRLDAGVQERVIDWLSEALGGEGYGQNNWKWFANVTQAFLRSVGGPYAPAEIEENLAFLEDCYLGDGWYSDGRPDARAGNIDWYNAWVMHLFSLWYCRILGPDAPEGLLDRYRERLAAFLPQGIALFGADGAPLFQGRSLVYRFATTGALWAGPIFGVDAVPAGRVRRVGSAAFRYFVQHGAFDDHQLLTLGWHGRFEPMRQSYSGPGSPYWSGLGFAGLVLADDHPLWSDVETDAPEEDSTVACAQPGWSLGGAGGIVRVVNHRVDHSGAQPGVEDPQYCRLGYSSATAPVPLPTGDQDRAVDNQVALRDASGRWSHRRPITAGAVEGGSGHSRHTAWFADGEDGWLPGPEIEVWTVLRGCVEVRLVRVGAGDTSSTLVMSGFALPASEIELVSSVTPLLGDLAVGESTHNLANPFGDRLLVPWVATIGAVRPGELYGASVVLGRRGDQHLVPIAEVDGDTVEITWADGQQDQILLAPG